MVSFPMAIASTLQIIITSATLGLQGRVVGAVAKRVRYVNGDSPESYPQVVNDWPTSLPWVRDSSKQYGEDWPWLKESEL